MDEETEGAEGVAEVLGEGEGVAATEVKVMVGVRYEQSDDMMVKLRQSIRKCRRSTSCSEPLPNHQYGAVRHYAWLRVADDRHGEPHRAQ